MSTYKFHPFCTAFNEYTAEEYAERLADYRAHPERAEENVTLLALHQGEWKIADGRHHYLICTELGYEVRFEKYDGSLADLKALVESRNGLRRHDSPGARAAAKLKLERTYQEEVEAEAKTASRDAKKPAAKKPTKKAGSRKQAAEAGVSQSTLLRAAKVEKQAPELMPAVEAGKLDAKTAAKVADLPKEVRETVAKAPDVKAAATAALNGADEYSLAEVAEADPGDQFVESVEKLCRDIDKVTAQVKALKGSPFAFSIHIDSAASQIVAARQTLWQGRPAHPCPYCRANDNVVSPECRACKGTGRVKKSVYESGVEAVGGDQ